MITSRAWTARVFLATSVDGYIARGDGDIEWLTDPPPLPHVPGTRGPDAPPDYAEFIAPVSHLVMGRGTYDKVCTFDSWPYADVTVLVLSTTLPPEADDRILVVASVAEACAALDADRATSIYVDGGQVVSTFLARGLIDELTISRAPVILGDGLPLFGHLPHQTLLGHLGTSTTDSGLVTTRYRVVPQREN